MKDKDILIIEPVDELAEIMAEAFTKEGFSCAIAQTAQEGIAQADRCMPRLVVLELLIPGHNGMEFIHEFRSYPEWLEVPIILYSHLSSDELGAGREVLADMGIRGHLYKPTTSLSRLVSTAEDLFASVNI